MPKIRAELSRKNKYWISKHRFYQLYYFCLQWPEKLDRLQELEEDFSPSADGERKQIGVYMSILTSSAEEASPLYAKAILRKVTSEGTTFHQLKNEMNLSCTSGQFGSLIHRFYWLLSQKELYVLNP